MTEMSLKLSRLKGQGLKIVNKIVNIVKKLLNVRECSETLHFSLIAYNS